MKYLILLVVIALFVWHWRSTRAPHRPAAPPTPQKPTGQPQAATDMQPCLHCGVHVPAADMVKGPTGSYCSTEHQQLAQR